MKELFKKLGAEFLGTAVLVFFAVGAAIMGGHFAGDIGVLIAGALAFGLVIIGMAYTIGGVSGCHINPAVTLGFLALGKIKVKPALFYMLAQFLGGIFGGLLLFSIFQLMGTSPLAPVADSAEALSALHNGSNFFRQLSPGAVGDYMLQAIVAGLMVEIILTFVFVFVILMVTSKLGNSKKAGLVIGFTLTLVHLVGIPFTGTSVNPARSFGAAVFGGVPALTEVWLFLIAPLIGAVLAALVARLFIGQEEKATGEQLKDEVAKGDANVEPTVETE